MHSFIVVGNIFRQLVIMFKKSTAIIRTNICTLPLKWSTVPLCIPGKNQKPHYELDQSG